jgi:hypothetical protein
MTTPLHSPTHLTLTNALPFLAQTVDELSAWQIVDHADPDLGAVVNADWGCADNKASSHFITAAVYLWLGTGGDDDDRLARALLAADSLLRAQRPSGNIDLISVNPDSGPDTGFTVQQLCTIFEKSEGGRVKGEE